MIQAEHLSHPQNLPEMLMENNAILHMILNNQAYQMEMIHAIYQTLKHHITGDPRPTDAFVREKEKLGQKQCKEYQKLVSQLFEINKMKYAR